MKKYDFAGWVTKNDVLCADGVVIKHGAFKDSDKAKVPLVWQHKHDDPTNVLGHVILHNKDQGVYGYGYFNSSEKSDHAREMVRNGDVSAMSIAANKIKKMGSSVVHGRIFEVSLVLSGANPGAMILEHSDLESDEEDTDFVLSEDEALIYTKNLIHSDEDLLEEDEEELEDDKNLQHKDGGKAMADGEKTIGDVLDTLSTEQMNAVEALVANLIENQEDLEQGDDTDMKNNVFNQQTDNEEVLTHSQLGEILIDAQKAGSLKEAILEHGITNIEILFPDAHNLNAEPVIFRDENTGAQDIVNAVSKSPFSRIKTRYADFTADEARAKGYIKGAEKVEQIFPVAQRETLPQTVYKKQKLDRDDIIDITDFDVVRFINKEMRFMLLEEIGRAVLVGDGRIVSDPDKIKEDKIRPIISDDDFYTLKREFTDETDLVESIVLGMADYKGSGAPIAYIDPTLLAKVKLLKGTDGRYLSGKILTDTEVATQLGVSAVKPTTLMAGKGVLIVNPKDYTLGATRGGEITTFDDFDIDFNQYKYLIEGRMSGALTLPHSAIHFAKSEGEE